MVSGSPVSSGLCRILRVTERCPVAAMREAVEGVACR
jgi:hypothetical protein